MKNILIILSVMLLGSCTEPVLESDQYTVVDTLRRSKNGFNHTLGYDVIIRLKSDSTLHYGYVTTEGTLTGVSILSLKPEQWKN